MFYISHCILGAFYTVAHVRSSAQGWGGSLVGEVLVCARVWVWIRSTSAKSWIWWQEPGVLEVVMQRWAESWGLLTSCSRPVSESRGPLPVRTLSKQESDGGKHLMLISGLHARAHTCTHAYAHSLLNKWCEICVIITCVINEEAIVEMWTGELTMSWLVELDFNFSQFCSFLEKKN